MLRERADTSAAPDADGDTSTLDQAATGLGIDLARLRSQRLGPGAGAEADRAEAMVEVWPELWQPLALFQSCLPQFELVAGIGGAQWSEPRAVNVERHMEWLGICGRRRRARVWALYRIFARKAVDVLNKRAKRAHRDC